MSGIIEELRAKWSEAAAAPPGNFEWRAIRVRAPGPVRAYAGVRERDGRIGIVVEADLSAAPRQRVRFDADGVSLMEERLPDARLLRLGVTLERNELRDVFEVLAVDLLSVATSVANQAEAVRALTRRLDAWQACLRTRRGALSREAQIGLLGELYMLLLIASEIGTANAVRAWQGPSDGLHDFHRAGTSIEVKTTSGIERRLAISTLDQLDTNAISRLVLARARLREAPGGKSLADVVEEVTTEVRTAAPSALADFENLLTRAGYLELDVDLYRSSRFEVHDMYGYEVRDGFPRILSSNVGPGIVSASYVIDEQAIASYKIGEEALRRAARGMGEKV